MSALSPRCVGAAARRTGLSLLLCDALVSRRPVCLLHVKIQNRGPEQETPAVTCVRLIAQKQLFVAPVRRPRHRVLGPKWLPPPPRAASSPRGRRSVAPRRFRRSTKEGRTCLWNESERISGRRFRLHEERVPRGFLEERAYSLPGTPQSRRMPRPSCPAS